MNINLKFIRDEAYVTEWSTKSQQIADDAQAAFESSRNACAETLNITV